MNTPKHTTPDGRRVVAITPARNEAHHFPGILRSMVAQTVRPALWVIVDDGSSDATGDLARAAAREHDWVRVVTRRDRGIRKLGGGVIAAFEDGLALVDEPWDYVGKVDADMTFGERYIETLLEHFEADPRLGSASGKVYRPEDGREVEEFMIDDMVAGQWKAYRRACFEDIGGLVQAVMWDGIDFHRARMHGWKTRSIAHPELRLLHHRLMGSSDRGVLRGRLRWGRGQWFMGTHPLYLLASAALRALERPRLVGGLCIAGGYLQAMVRRDQRYDDNDFRRELQRWQLSRLRDLVTQGKVR